MCVVTTKTLCMSAEKKSWQGIHIPSVYEIKEHFANPPSEYASHVIWGLEGNITKQVIQHDLDSIKARGFRAVILEAGYNLPCKYLSDEWFKLIRQIVNEAKKRSLKVWIIDEGKYPSGFAGGKFSEERPELRMKALVNVDNINVKPGDVLKDYPVDNEVISAVAVNTARNKNTYIKIVDHKISFVAGLDNWTILLVKPDFRTGQTRSVNNPTRAKDTKNSQMDYLNPMAVRQYIEWTHEQYKRYIGNEFGKTVLGFRGDEPDYSHLPFTQALLDSFKVMKGYEPTLMLSSMFSPIQTIAEKRFKADYWDVWSRLFANNYFKQVADWCEANKLAHITHLNNDHNMPVCVKAEGNLFRDLSNVQIPGVDAIWNQIWPDTVNDFPKFASSVAHVYGKPRSFSESFAAYYSTPTIAEAKYVVDYQMIRGINFFEFMFWMAGSKDQGWMSQPGMKQLNDYTNRTAYLLTQGSPGARIAMYYPTSSLWMDDNNVAERIKKISHLLLQHQRDFDYVDDDAFSEALSVKYSRLENKSGQRYSTLIIPSSDAISVKAWSMISQFEKQGGKVLFWGNVPRYLVDKTYTSLTPFMLEDHSLIEPTDEYTSNVQAAMPNAEIVVNNLQQFEPNNAPRRSGDPKRLPFDQTLDIRYTRRILPEGEFYFIFNEGHHNQKISIGMDAIGNVSKWNTLTGEIMPIQSFVKDNRTWVNLEMKEYETVMLSVSCNDRKYLVTDYGAVGDGVTVNTKCLQATIDSIYYHGGGTMVVPRGNFVTGALFFRQGVNLYLEKDSRLTSTIAETDFPLIPTRFEGIEQVWKSALLNFTDCKGVRVEGQGMIDGKGVEWKSHPFGTSGRPRLICFTRCDGGQLRGLNLKDQASWCIHILYTDSFTVDGTVIRAEHTIPSSDGIDIDSSKGVVVRNADIEDNDDCISIKSGKDDDGRRVGRPSENILIENCRFGYGHSGVDIGSEVSGDIRNVLVQNCLMDKDNAGSIRIKSQPSRGGVIENITFRDITLNNPRLVFDINMRWRMVPPIAPTADKLTELKNIQIINVKGTCRSMGEIKGYEQSPITGILFKNCDIKTEKNLILTNTENINLEGLKVDVKY